MVTSGAVSGCWLTFCLHPDATMESGKIEAHFTVAVLVLSKFGNLATPSLQGESSCAGSVAEPSGAVVATFKFGNFSAPSLEGESVFTSSLIEPVIAFRMMICVTAATLSAALGGFAHGFCTFLGLHRAGYASAAFLTLSAFGSLVSLRVGSMQRKDKGAVKNQIVPVSDGSLPQVCFVGSGNKMLVSMYCWVIVRIFEILVASPCCVSFENQAAAAISRLITLVGLLLLLSDDQGPFVLEFCTAAALCRILALEEGVAVPARFGFVCGCLELAAACVFMVACLNLFQSPGWNLCIFLCLRTRMVFDRGRSCSRMEQS